jgi:Leucine-rich repeat (LRR) protein
MKALEKNDLKQFPNLRSLGLEGNELQWLDDDVFEFTPKLEWISFGDNKLKFIGANILQPLTNLSYAWFDDNKCIDDYAITKERIAGIKQKLVTNATVCLPKCRKRKIFTKKN